MQKVSVKELVRRDLGAVVSTTWIVGLFFMIGLQSWLRGDPSYWIMVAMLPILVLVVIFLCRRIMKRIP